MCKVPAISSFHFRLYPALHRYQVPTTTKKLSPAVSQNLAAPCSLSPFGLPTAFKASPSAQRIQENGSAIRIILITRRRNSGDASVNLQQASAFTSEHQDRGPPIALCLTRTMSHSHSITHTVPLSLSFYHPHCVSLALRCPHRFSGTCRVALPYTYDLCYREQSADSAMLSWTVLGMSLQLLPTQHAVCGYQTSL